ncbi:hypothetical protein [Symbiobacterium terraclitae]|uniref:hypothetical protein n=1 Tax=Symbiobacterium terraclitae TaxID=557451 RepID=UPI0035B4FC65
MIRVVIVTNPYDTVEAPAVAALQAELAANVPDAEVRVVDFNRVRSYLPISQTPTVCMSFDQHVGQFDPALVTQAIRAVQQSEQ